MSDGMRAMSNKEMEEIALSQAAGMRNAGMIAADHMRGMRDMSNRYAAEVANVHVIRSDMKKETVFKRLSMWFSRVLDKP